MQDFQPIKLQELIDSTGLSQRKFAIKIGVDPAMITRWLKGEVQIQRRTIMRIKAIYPEFLEENTTKSNKSGQNSFKTDIPVFEDPSAAYAGDQLPEQPMFYANSIFPEAELAVPVYGDAASPDYKRGTYIALREKKNTSFFAPGKYYYLVTTEEDFLRRVYKADDNTYELRSPNPDFPNFVLPMDQVSQIFIVLGTLRPDDLMKVRIYNGK